MSLKDSRGIVVTGGSGFIGSHFIEQSFINYPNTKIINIDSLTYASSSFINDKFLDFKNYQFINLNINDGARLSQVLDELEFDHIFHFAAESHVDNSINSPHDFLETNIIGTYNLLNFLVKKFESNCPIIFHHISTDEVFGSLSLNEESFEESSVIKPNSPYSASKASSDLLVRAWNKTFNIPFIITNCSNNFGPRQHQEKLIPKVINNAINREIIPIYGSGKNIRDWLYVEDHIDAIFAIHNHDLINDSFNIGGSNEVANIDIVNKIIDILEQEFYFKDIRQLITFVEDRKGHDFRYSINSNKLFECTGWKQTSIFEEKLLSTIDYYLNN